MEGNRKSDEHKFSSEHRRVSSNSSGEVGDHLEGRGSLGGSHCENLALELVKSLTRIEERSESQSIDEE